MEVKLAEHYGMCHGVITALKRTDNAIEKYQEYGSICTLGNLVNNPHVVSHYQEHGVDVIDSIDEIASGTVIIRAHGVPSKIKDEARNRGLDVVDATCNLVLRLQRHAEELKRKGYHVVVYGKEDHPEIIGITGNLGKRDRDYSIVRNLEETVALGEYPMIGAVSQTTGIQSEYEKIQEVLKKKCMNFKAEETICKATAQIQDAARILAEETEAMVVIGDVSSSNSKNLVEICKEVQQQTFFIGGVKDLDPEWFKGVNQAGLTAGASTPDWVIEEVKRAMEAL